MSYDYINGFNYGKLFVYFNGSEIDSFTFPIENIQGKKENVQDDIIHHKLLYLGEIAQSFQGTRLVWEIPFEEWASLPVMKIMKKLRQYRNSNIGYQFYLQPNIDVDRTFDVLLYNEKINLGIESANVDAPFNTGVIFSFITRFYVDENWIDKNEIPIIGLLNFNRVGIFN